MGLRNILEKFKRIILGYEYLRILLGSVVLVVKEYRKNRLIVKTEVGTFWGDTFPYYPFKIVMELDSDPIRATEEFFKKYYNGGYYEVFYKGRIWKKHISLKRTSWNTFYLLKVLGLH